ncbi:Chaperone protein DnaK [Flavobacterium bizetiae]|uniref:Chaperone protein DnaK n=1 Tax=Flavobacterium bizetiae TaxID=2704140 RepID=A0A6J4GVK5_9FLAO|nr:Hsp70 family protein [Flavobacterium bizetiae]CAA9202877.1 Chaperone protein DnaK [Flavobacterium bizetiae]CAD5343566.1 Chaperone protein DnaK [Flavobacterium bizetiae]CAD5349560.1 Chaperone protein DnaK [Flavobacterium bizetiae]
MENTINYGIDLGTTNSAIAKFIKGEVIIFSNPQDYGRNTLPSVVSYKKDKITVGNKAKEFLEKDPKSVVGVFKRKMGTSESFKIKSINESKTPIELSAQVLKELKTFVNTGDNLDAVVITIPASFDTIQSNATKEAGIQAGFKQVVLLQEPIAASLAYANMKKEREMQEGQWLVYDLGGGTFDVALIKIKDGEMKVLDHEGNNFLGGADFDNMIVEKLVIPKICEKFNFSNLEDDMKSASGKLNAKYYVLLRRAEEAKITLSSKTSAEIIVDGFEDEDGNEVDMEIVITRSEFNELIRPNIDGTIKMIKQILTRNSLKPIDLQFTLMVGGSTYIPYVRSHVEEVLQIPANCEIDPTTAVAIGAAYYSATKPKEIEKTGTKAKTSISIKTSYNKASKEKDELFSARITGSTDSLSYRITRQDGGFDSGIKKLTERISEDLPLVDGAFNFFSLVVYDSQNNIIETDIEPIGINSGFGISGQPIPEDICLEVDDYDNPGKTRLQLVFQKNTILPSKKTLSYPLNKTIIKGSEDEVIRVNILEGSHLALPEANKGIGFMQITGKNLSRDVSKGSDIEITITISESRDLTISAYLNMADQEFKQTFNPKERHIPVNELKEQVEDLSGKLEFEIQEATDKEDFETAGALSKLKKEMETVSEETESLTNDDVTDKRYQLEDKKRKIAQEIDSATKNKRIQQVKAHYFEIKEECEKMLDENGNDHERKTFNDIVAQESVFFSTNSPLKIQEKSDELHSVLSRIRWRTPDFLTDIFQWCKNNQTRMNDQNQAKSLVDAGNFAIESQNWDRLSEINSGLLNLLPRGAEKEATTRIGFGL